MEKSPYFDDITKSCHHNMTLSYRSPAPRLHMKIWSSQWDPPCFNLYRKNYLIKIECADLENEAKTMRNATNLSFKCVVATSCRMTPYYSLSLSRVSSTSHVPVLLFELKQSKLYESCWVGFRIMARERMAKLPKYGHFDWHIEHIIFNFMTMKNYIIIT